LNGKILFATVSKTTTEKYYVSITCEQNHHPYIYQNHQKPRCNCCRRFGGKKYAEKS